MEDLAKRERRNLKWRAEHPEQQRAIYARYRAANRDARNAYNAQWYAAHREQQRAYSANHTHRKRANGGNFPRAAWEYLKALFGHCCAYCGRRFERLTQDHVVPISKGGWHCSMNIVPACRSCNSRKGTKGLDRPPARVIR